MISSQGSKFVLYLFILFDIPDLALSIQVWLLLKNNNGLNPNENWYLNQVLLSRHNLQDHACSWTYDTTNVKRASSLTLRNSSIEHYYFTILVLNCCVVPEVFELFLNYDPHIYCKRGVMKISQSFNKHNQQEV